MSTLDGLSRVEKAEVVRALCETGLTQAQAAERLGLSRSYASALLIDPTGEKEDARKRLRHGTCVDCGGPTFNGGAIISPKRCRTCSEQRSHEERYWKPERIITAIQEWAEIHGEPPRAMDWLVRVKRRGTPNEGRVPSVGVVQREFGTWSNALEAAGFERRVGYERTDEWKASVTKWPKERMIESAREWADIHGKRPTSYQWRLPGPNHPAYSTVVKKFGRWSTFLDTAFGKVRTITRTPAEKTAIMTAPVETNGSREGASLLDVVAEMFPTT